MKQDDEDQLAWLAQWRNQQKEKQYYKTMIHYHWNALVDWIRKYFRKDWKK